ncbi:alpha/beta fold hydrolase [Actibacterium lipolyticum]|uniref:Haloacetate dehalogenase H-1 n=1 Tax=Actibacterium lipolyticum TaxID=1524263 RepID=A0A238JVM4_9RHOB|nr:alpha/beta hydrolase [Actibacterium lipolyticum]SMX34728.1 Haloacetate dehalogenase H-1 [Actibacterium lipolyticum]
MPRASLRGHTIHYQQVGQGPDVVLIHGLFCNIAFWWFRVAPKLAEKHRVTALDLRGHGFSAMSNGGYRAVDLADDVVALMAHLGIEKAHLIGHSFGGAVALAVAVKHADQVECLTLADAWVPSLQTMPPLNDSAAWAKLQARLRKRGIVVDGEPPRVAQGFLEEMLDAEDEGEPVAGGDGAGAFAGMQVSSAGQRPTRAMRRWRELMERTSANSQFRDPAGLDLDHIRAVERPVDLIYGARSRYLTSRDGLAEALPNAHPVEIPNAGHYFPLLRPEALLSAVATGVKSMPPSGTKKRKEHSVD